MTDRELITSITKLLEDAGFPDSWSNNLVLAEIDLCIEEYLEDCAERLELALGEINRDSIRTQLGLTKGEERE